MIKLAAISAILDARAAAVTGGLGPIQVSTLFLDEIGTLSYNGQASLLRFLQEGEVRPVGSHRAVKTDVRVISATNRNLKRAMENGEFQFHGQQLGFGGAPKGFYIDLFTTLTGFPAMNASILRMVSSMSRWRAPSVLQAM